MHSDFLFIGVMNLFVSILCAAVCVPLLNGKTKMNRWYGVRIPKAYVSEENWIKINDYGSRAMIGWCVPIALLAIGTIAAAFSVDPGKEYIAWSIPLGLSGLLVLGALVQTIWWSRNLPGK